MPPEYTAVYIIELSGEMSTGCLSADFPLEKTENRKGHFIGGLPGCF